MKTQTQILHSGLNYKHHAQPNPHPKHLAKSYQSETPPMQPNTRDQPVTPQASNLSASSPNSYSGTGNTLTTRQNANPYASPPTPAPTSNTTANNTPVSDDQPNPTPNLPSTDNSYQGGWNVPTIDDEVNKITGSDSLTMQQAKQQGMRNAGSRGLLNSSIAGQASQQAAIQAATPIAQQNVQNQIQQQQFAQSVTANTQGQYMKATNDIINQALISINEIEKAQGISQGDKDKMIENTIKRRDEDLKFMKSFYSMMPTWSGSWVNFPTMPPAPGLA